MSNDQQREWPGSWDTPQGSAHYYGFGTCRVHRRATRAVGEADEPGRHGAMSTKLGTRRSSPAI